MTTEATAEPIQTFAEYKAERLAPPAPPVEPTPPPASAAEEKEAPAVEPEVAEEEAETPPPTKPKRSLEGRFSELTGRAKAAEARAAEAEARAAALEAKLAPPKAKDDEEPQASAYTDAFEYARDLSKWSTAKALKERDEAQAKAAVQQSWNSRLTATKAEIPDFDEVLSSASDIAVSDVVRDSLVESEVGPKILYHLAQNPDEAEKLNKLSPAAALRAIGRLEAKFEQAPAPAPAPKAPAPRAPQPVTPIRATAVADTKVNAAGEFEGSFAQYKALRAQGKI